MSANFCGRDCVIVPQRTMVPWSLWKVRTIEKTGLLENHQRTRGLLFLLHTLYKTTYYPWVDA